MIDKYTNGEWTSLDKYKIYEQYNPTITAFPTTVDSSGNDAQDYKIYGNTTQSGTPTPDSPVDVVGCGEIETTGVHAGQYKLLLTSAGRGIDIYLGEVPTTRRIEKMVLTGEESVFTPNNYPNRFYIYVGSSLNTANLITIVVSHYEAKKNATLTNLLSYPNGTACFRTVNNQLWFHDNRFTSNTAFKAFLTQQYANGTPVTVWYVRANEETAVVNEPLMKIGDYADTVSMEQAGVSIPTTSGETTIDYTGAPVPSQIDLDLGVTWVSHKPKIYRNGAWVDA